MLQNNSPILSTFWFTFDKGLIEPYHSQSRVSQLKKKSIFQNIKGQTVPHESTVQLH